jgi:hypothetical protein
MAFAVGCTGPRPPTTHEAVVGCWAGDVRSTARIGISIDTVGAQASDDMATEQARNSTTVSRLELTSQRVSGTNFETLMLMNFPKFCKQ